MDRADRLKRLRFRAWHRGTKEADMLIGGFYDRYGAEWNEAKMAWFEALLEEQDVDIMAWAIGTAAPPERWDGAMMQQLQTVNYIKHAR
ncbi:succinate dehydrogenase assembly factor 2 [Allosphingosinicella sp.]|uniref:FAD assembly factor SdhE n=1 Tax=Allosphingosinicella sp. TaxID=2823234 RepID=UPI002FC1E928